MNAAELGRQLARRRREVGLTQVELARRMSTTQSAIARAESDWTSMPTLDFLDRFARATGGPMQITVGAEVSTANETARKARQALGSFEFDPWRRGPSPAEARSLLKDGIRRGRSGGTTVPGRRAARA